MRKMRKKLTTLIASSMAMAMVFGTGITAYAAGDHYKEGFVPTAVTPGGVIVYGCYYEDILFAGALDFPEEYLFAIDAAGITNEMSDYEKCVRVNDYLCAIAEYGDEYEIPPRTTFYPSDPNRSYFSSGPFADLYDNEDLRPGGGRGIDLIKYGKGFCMGYADAFQTMTSMLGMESYVFSSNSMDHSWNAVIADDVLYYVDVTWNDNIDYPNRYLMSTELWNDHSTSDVIKTCGPTYGGWEVIQMEEQQKMEEFMNGFMNGYDHTTVEISIKRI